MVGTSSSIEHPRTILYPSISICAFRGSDSKYFLNMPPSRLYHQGSSGPAPDTNKILDSLNYVDISGLVTNWLLWCTDHLWKNAFPGASKFCNQRHLSWSTDGQKSRDMGEMFQGKAWKTGKIIFLSFQNIFPLNCGKF